MKKKTKIILIVVGAFFALIAIVGVSNVGKVKPMSEKEYMIKFAKEHQKKMDEQVRYGDKERHIKSITYEWNTVYKNPMGGFYISGYVNDDKNIDFQIYFDKSSGKLKCWTNSISPKLAEWKGIDN